MAFPRDFHSGSCRTRLKIELSPFPRAQRAGSRKTSESESFGSSNPGGGILLRRAYSRAVNMQPDRDLNQTSRSPHRERSDRAEPSRRGSNPGGGIFSANNFVSRGYGIRDDTSAASIFSSDRTSRGPSASPVGDGSTALQRAITRCGRRASSPRGRRVAGDSTRRRPKRSRRGRKWGARRSPGGDSARQRHPTYTSSRLL